MDAKDWMWKKPDLTWIDIFTFPSSILVVSLMFVFVAPWMILFKIW